MIISISSIPGYLTGTLEVYFFTVHITLSANFLKISLVIFWQMNQSLRMSLKIPSNIIQQLRLLNNIGQRLKTIPLKSLENILIFFFGSPIEVLSAILLGISLEMCDQFHLQYVCYFYGNTFIISFDV